MSAPNHHPNHPPPHSRRRRGRAVRPPGRRPGPARRRPPARAPVRRARLHRADRPAVQLLARDRPGLSRLRGLARARRVAHPEPIAGLVSQNANIAPEGLGEPLGPLAAWWADRGAGQPTVDAFLSADGTRMQWAAGLRDPETLDPAPVELDVALLAEPGRRAAAEALLWDYQTNPPRYPAWQAWLAEHHPPTLAIWGTRDPFFVPAGAEAFRHANPDAEVVLIDTGHFALVEALEPIATAVHDLLTRAYA